MKATWIGATVLAGFAFAVVVEAQVGPTAKVWIDVWKPYSNPPTSEAVGPFDACGIYFTSKLFVPPCGILIESDKSGNVQTIKVGDKVFDLSTVRAVHLHSSCPGQSADGAWTAIAGAENCDGGKHPVNVTIDGERFSATASYTNHGQPYSWRMEGTISGTGKVFAKMYHSALQAPVDFELQLSPDGMKFTGNGGLLWVRE